MKLTPLSRGKNELLVRNPTLMAFGCESDFDRLCANPSSLILKNLRRGWEHASLTYARVEVENGVNILCFVSACLCQQLFRLCIPLKSD